MLKWWVGFRIPGEDLEYIISVDGMSASEAERKAWEWAYATEGQCEVSGGWEIQSIRRTSGA